MSRVEDAVSKVTTLSDAVSRLIDDGDSVCLAGLTHLIPYAAAHEIIRQGKRNLELIRATPDLLCEQMLVAGSLRKVVYSWAGNPGLGLLRVFRKAVEEGRIETEEYTHYGMVARLMAGAMHLPFFPIRTMAGTDLPKVNTNIKTISDPYTGEVLHTVPALNPDVTVMHVQRCDHQGNAHIWGFVGEVKEAAFAARRLIVTTEEVVNTEMILSDPNRVLVPGFKVDAVVAAPWGAHPSYAQGYYDRDNAFYHEWSQSTANEDRVRAWLAEYVLGTPNHVGYLERIGHHRLDGLRVPEGLAAPVNYGVYGGAVG
ncbi:MAG: CoA transferase subunit A [Actinobacteria bacterium]|nr:CoA transferase subunit A [Actinomycetota bacterium]MCL5736473.1 CoA transferase subunit A [Actinomycetota bacterium]